MTEAYKVLIVDDHAILRDGLKSIIATVEDFEVVGEAASSGDALEIVKKTQPHVATIDLSLPDGSGLLLTRQLRESFPSTKILIVSMHSKVHNIMEAFKAGASGFVAKESASDQLLRGLQTVVEGGLFLDDSLSPLLIQSLTGDLPASARSKGYEEYESLTPREREILILVAEGLSAKQVAATLHISPKTVENHRTSIMKKLNIHSTVELVRYCARLGLIDLGD